MTDSTLDDLFREARQAMRQEMKARQRRPREPSPAELSADERLRRELGPIENWERVRSVALVHQETATLLGKFVEYRHVKAPGARRLVREITELPVTETEFVTGKWELRLPEQPPVRAHIWQRTLPACLDLVLYPMHVSAPCVCVLAAFGEGRLDRVELVEETTFTSPTRPELFILPPGTNILPELSQASIKALLTQLGHHDD